MKTLALAFLLAGAAMAQMGPMNMPGVLGSSAPGMQPIYTAPAYTPRPVYTAPVYTPPVSQPVTGSAMQLGNSTYYNWSNGASGTATRVGNTTYYQLSDGTTGTATRIGGTTYWNWQ